MKPGEVVFSIILVLALLVAPVPSDGQQSGKVYRIGLLSAGIPADKSPQGCPIKDNPFWEAFVEGLRERGYNQGQNLFIACRYTEAGDEHAPALAVELVRLKVDLLVAYGTAQALAAKRATNTLPIVMVGVEDPVRRGLVASLAHPGGTVTGPMGPGADFAGNYVHLLKETVPTLARLAVLAYAGVPWHPPDRGQIREIEAAAQALGVTVQSYRVQASEELASTFAAMTQARADALLVHRQLFGSFPTQRIVDLAAHSRLPAVYPYQPYVDAGGLMSFGYYQRESFRRIGTYVDKILRGAKPGDLPMEPATKFDLVINLKTAKALGVTIPQSLLNRADKVIE